MSEPHSPFQKKTIDKDLEKFGFIESATQFVLLRAAAPGLAVIFMAASALFASLFIAPGTGSVVILVAAVLAAYMAMNIGANDVTNNVGAAVGSGAITMSGALLLAAFCEIAGAVLAGGNVVATIKSDIVGPAMIGSTGDTVVVMISALLSAAIWINIATWVNAPVSTTHSIVGSIIGAGAVTVGPAVIDWSSLLAIAFSWVISPLLGAAIAIAFLWFIIETILRREDKIAAARRWVPVLLAVMTGTFLSYILLVAARRIPDLLLWQVLLIGTFLGGASYVWFRDTVARQSVGLENRGQSLRILFRIPLVFSAALLSFAHGANDVANAIGPMAAIVEAQGIQTIASNLDAPFWVTMIGALGISAGLMLFGPRLIRIVGTEITRLNPVRAYCVAIAAAITVIIASALGLPVSSTHIAVGSVFGVGFFREWYNARDKRLRLGTGHPPLTEIDEPSRPAGPASDPGRKRPVSEETRYRYLVRRSHLFTILAAWLVTVPVSGGLAALIALAINTFLG